MSDLIQSQLRDLISLADQQAQRDEEILGAIVTEKMDFANVQSTLEALSAQLQAFQVASEQEKAALSDELSSLISKAQDGLAKRSTILEQIANIITVPPAPVVEAPAEEVPVESATDNFSEGTDI